MLRLAHSAVNFRTLILKMILPSIIEGIPGKNAAFN
jgi:hypothetical protein